MRIIVSDSNCLIDLRKAALLAAFLNLPYEILIPNTLFEEELLKFSEAEKTLLTSGLTIVDLPGEQVLRATEVMRTLPHLSVHDGLAFALAEASPGCILLTGDGPLRELAEAESVEVHGVLWVLDEIFENELATAQEIVTVLQLFEEDQTVRLPRAALTRYIKRYTSET